MLKGKNAIITGARRGIGHATVEVFAENGANIWACARTPDAEFEAELAALSEKHGVWIKPVYFDLADEAALKVAVKGILSEKRPVDILVNNAGMPLRGGVFTTNLDDMRKVFEINFFAQISLMQYIAKYMLRRRCGSIINVASIAGLDHWDASLAYGSSKAAFIWATQSCAKELAPHGIRVNAVAPGVTDTKMGNFRTPQELEQVLHRTPIGRMAAPIEVAECIAFLASDKASYVTGEIMCVDGGRL